MNIKHEPEEIIIDVAAKFEEELSPEAHKAIKSETPDEILKSGVIFCDICYKQFKSSHVLETHKLKIHDGTPSKSELLSIWRFSNIQFNVIQNTFGPLRSASSVINPS